jgi:hypothetical protein
MRSNRQPKFNRNNLQEFYDACSSGDHKKVQEILEDNSIRISNDHLGFITACQKGHLQVVKLLLADSRINVKATIAPQMANLNAFNEACKKDHNKVVRCLLQDERFDIRKMLEEAIQNKNEKQIAYLSSYWNVSNWTALIALVLAGDLNTRAEDSNSSNNNIIRFLFILLPLPPEVRVPIINLTAGVSINYVPTDNAVQSSITEILQPAKSPNGPK